MRVRRPSATGLVLFLLCLMYLITYIDRVNLATAAEPIRKDFKLSNTQLGLAFSAFGYAYLALQVSGGFIADKFGPRKTLTLSGLIWAGSTILTGLVGGLWSLFAARLLLGIGEGATFPTATRAMSNWTPAAKRGFAQGITHSFARIGNALAPPLVVGLMAWLTWRGSFIILGLCSVIWVIVWWIYFRDDPREHASVTPAEIATLPSFRGAGSLSKNPIPWGPLTLRMTPVIVVYFCYGWTLWLYLNWLPQFFLHGFKLDLKRSAFFSMGVFLAGVVGDTAGGLVSDAILHRTRNVVRARSHLVFVSMLGSLLCLIPVLYVHDLTWIAVFLSGAFFFLELTIGPIWAIPMDIAPAYSGTASGLMNSGSALAAIVSPLAFGMIIDRTGNWTLPFVGSIALLGFGAVLSFFMRPEKTLTVPPPVPPSGALAANK
ncbi:MAG TPA: MFS transporter [Myxococcales bacterium]|nr:MFS transporter [Myxococcales bacterium]